MGNKINYMKHCKPGLKKTVANEQRGKIASDALQKWAVRKAMKSEKAFNEMMAGLVGKENEKKIK